MSNNIEYDFQKEVRADLEDIKHRIGNLEDAEYRRDVRREEEVAKFAENHAQDLVIRSMVKDNHKAIFGNGRKGLLDRQTQTETTIQNVARLIKWQITTTVAFMGTVAYVIFEMWPE